MAAFKESEGYKIFVDMPMVHHIKVVIGVLCAFK